MNEAQREAIQALCNRYHVNFDPADYHPAYDLPQGWVAGWIGGVHTTIYIGCDPEGAISS